MSASRALPEDLDAIEEVPSAGSFELGQARRMLTGEARRALVADEPAFNHWARRANAELDPDDRASYLIDANEELASGSVVAFAVPRRRKHMGRQLVAALSVVAVIGSLSALAASGSVAMSAAPASTVTMQLIDRQAAVSRDATRTEIAGISPSASASASALNSSDDSSAVSTEKAPEPAEEPAAPAAANPAATVATNIAPGQLPAASVDEAIARAEAMTGNWGYQNMCLSLVATFYGYTSAGEVGAQQAAATAAAAGQLHTDMSNIPVGALIWYDGTPVGNPYGHVAMYAGNGMVYSNGAPTGVGLIPLEEPATGWGEPIIGWSSVWLPAATK